MTISIFDIFSIGIGPSSSHTIGPMRAVRSFLNQLGGLGRLQDIGFVQVELYGSLGLTGKAHGTDKAVMLALEGDRPETTNPQIAAARMAGIRQKACLHLDQDHEIVFDETKHLVFHRHQSLPTHPNGMILSGFDRAQALILKKTYYSVGGGFIVEDGQVASDPLLVSSGTAAYGFQSAKQLLDLGKQHHQKIYEMILANELLQRSQSEIEVGVQNIWSVMQDCVQTGLKQSGILPGGLKVERRAAKIYKALSGASKTSTQDPLVLLDWVNLYALAVNEENAAGGRVVTAPTNGAAGIVPAVMHYYRDLRGQITDDEVLVFLLTAAAIAILFKQNASISGAEVGCQGEVGVACSMAAAGLTALLGGTNEQIENAAEIGMEHNLGLTCDPVGGLVQIPCIERNAMGAIKAINASRLALRGDGTHRISLDRVIRTMRETGRDMQSKYKETSQGGLAVNYVDC